MGSIRTRLLGGIIISMALLLVIFSIIIFLTIRHVLLEEFDSSLKAAADILAASVKVDEHKVEFEVNPQKVQELQGIGQAIYFQFWMADGKVLKRSESMGRQSLPMFFGPNQEPVYRSVVLLNNQPGRAVGIWFEPVKENEEQEGNDMKEGKGPSHNKPNQQGVILVVAKETGQLRSQLRFLGGFLILAGAAIMGLALLSSFLIVKEGLKPLRGLASQIAVMEPDNLDGRIHFQALPSEMVPIVDKLNDFLVRLEEAFIREKSFSADVAHELRTPLAGIRSTLEVTLSGDREPGEYQEAISDCLEITQQMQTMIDKLLMLSRMDTGQITFHREKIALRELVEVCWEVVSEKARVRGLTFDDQFSDAVTVFSDRASLVMVLLNLLENAAAYADEGGLIRISGRQRSDGVELTISNTGCRLSKEDVTRIFERFWRADPSRKDTGIHCGLGLTIVQRMLNALGGKVKAQVDEKGIFTVCIVLDKGLSDKSRNGETG